MKNSVVYVNKIYDKDTKVEYSSVRVIVNKIPMPSVESLVVRLSDNRKLSLNQLLLTNLRIIGMFRRQGCVDIMVVDKLTVTFMSRCMAFYPFVDSEQALHGLMDLGISAESSEEIVSNSTKFLSINNLNRDGLTLECEYKSYCRDKIFVSDKDCNLFATEFIMKCKKVKFKNSYIVAIQGDDGVPFNVYVLRRK